MASTAVERDSFPAFLYVYVDDAYATYRRALEAGASSIEEPLETRGRRPTGHGARPIWKCLPDRSPDWLKIQLRVTTGCLGLPSYIAGMSHDWAWQTAKPNGSPSCVCFGTSAERMFSETWSRLSPICSGPDLRVLFCGINPGKRSGDLGQHFARPGNRFWKLLCAGGFTESVLAPAEQHTLPGLGIGITNLVGRVTAAASELSVAELREGATQLEAKVGMLRPRCVGALGLQAYRTAFLRPEAVIGPRARTPRRCPSLAPTQPERTSGPLSAAENE